MNMYNGQKGANQSFLKPGKRPAIFLSKGFTLVELIIVMAIVAILLFVATPNLNSVMIGSKIDDGRMTVATSLAMARSEAVTRSQNASLCVGVVGGASCGTTDTGNVDWSSGWRVIINGQLVQLIERDDSQVSIEYSCGEVLTFNSSGARANGVSAECVFTTSDASGGGSDDKVLRIAQTGRVRLE
ncbi:MAG: GspH/FimT family pseudopilin [Motiliproteus sp.]